MLTLTVLVQGEQVREPAVQGPTTRLLALTLTLTLTLILTCIRHSTNTNAYTNRNVTRNQPGKGSG